MRDYTAGQVDWYAYGLPMEGRLARVQRAGRLARPNAPICRLQEPANEALARAQAGGWDLCVVVNDERVVLGLLRGAGAAVPDGASAESLMESGPATFRPDSTLDAPLRYMRRHNVGSVLVTTPDGCLRGVLFGTDAERAPAGA